MPLKDKVRAQRRIFAQRFKTKFESLEIDSDIAVKNLLIQLEEELVQLTNEAGTTFFDSDDADCESDDDYESKNEEQEEEVDKGQDIEPEQIYQGEWDGDEDNYNN